MSSDKYVLFVMLMEARLWLCSSIHDLKPQELVVLFISWNSFQDHVAVGFIEMFENSELSEVWMETHKDITLLWGPKDRLEVESSNGEQPKSTYGRLLSFVRPHLASNPDT